MKRILLLALAGALIAVPAAFAGRNMNGATLNVSPANPVVGDNVTFSGCNYQPNFVLTLTVQVGDKSGAETFVDGNIVTDASGCFSTATDPYQPSAGTYYVATWYGNGHRVSSSTFSVTG